MPDALQLAELVAARICHDFGGPLGTLMASAELLAEGVVEPGDASAAVIDAAGMLSRRLKFLRAAWGAGGSAMTALQLSELVEGVPAQGRATLDISALPDDAPLGPGLARTLLNVILLAGEALPKGGVIRVFADPPSGRVLVLPEGPSASWPTGVTGGPAELSARTLLPPLANAIARQAGFLLSLVPSAGAHAPMLAIGSAGKAGTALHG